MTKTDIDIILNQLKHKPKRFHFTCFGGGTCKLVDFWADTPTAPCGNTGDGKTTYGGWINGHACTTGCNRRLYGTKDINDMQRYENYGMERLAFALKERLSSESHSGERQ